MNELILIPARGGSKGLPNKNIKLSHPLDGIKVLDLTGYIAGAYGTTMLSDLGADVLKVESFAGDGFRQNSAAFQGWNQGKRGAIFNLKTPEGMKIFHQLYQMVLMVDICLGLIIQEEMFLLD